LKETKDVYQSSERNKKEFFKDDMHSSEDEKMNYRDELTMFMKNRKDTIT